MGVKRMLVKFFKRLFQKKECNYSEKLIFLVNQTRKWFYALYQNKNNSRINIPYMISADFRTKEEISKIVKENRVNECFKKCVDEMLKDGEVDELKAYGII